MPAMIPAMQPGMTRKITARTTQSQVREPWGGLVVTPELLQSADRAALVGPEQLEVLALRVLHEALEFGPRLRGLAHVEVDPGPPKRDRGPGAGPFGVVAGL